MNQPDTRPMTFDVLVIGGGPGGSTAALTLARQGLSVAVLEKDRHPRFHIGESFLPRIVPLLEELGLLKAVQSLPHLPKYGAMFIMADGDEPARMHFEESLIPGSSTLNLERAPFDHMLIRQAEAAGAKVFEGTTVKTIDRLEEGAVEVTTPAGRFAARMLIDASGHGTVVGRHFDRRRTEANDNLRRVAYFEHFEGVEMFTGDEAGSPLLVMADEGWFWMINLDGQRTSVGFVAKPGLVQQVGLPANQMLAWAVARAPVVRERMRNAKGPETNRVLANFTYDCAPYAGPGYFLVGDAACFLDPIFSTGVTLAMITGHEAAKHTVAVLSGKTTTKAAGKRYTGLFKNGSRVLFKLVRGYYNHPFRELLHAPAGPMKVRAAVIAALAGQVFPKPRWSLRWRLHLFHFIVVLQGLFEVVPRKKRWSLLSPEAQPMPASETSVPATAAAV